jgi:NAD(P)-dependent dehydrogenase (short-subunit alcohol dehydrogenase family)
MLMDWKWKGIEPVANYLSDEVDSNGDPVEPNQKTMDVNLKGCMNTVTLGVFYLKKNKEGGSIVMTASGSSE